MSAIEPRLDNRHLDDTRCADLHLGLLPAGERAAALAHLAACPACESRLRAHVGAAERAAADAPGARARVVTPIAWYRRPATAWLAAAAAVLVIAGTIPMLRPAPRVSDAPSHLPSPGAAVGTRAGEGEDAHLTAGLDAYARHDLAAAERELSAARTTGGAEPLRRVYLADVKLALGDAHAAIALLRGVRWLDVPEPWRHDAIALYARALRRAGEGASADSIERALATHDPSTPFVP